MVWSGSEFLVFASKYLACAEADYLANDLGREVFVETLRGCCVVYVGIPTRGG
jgi:hypothetical protein